MKKKIITLFLVIFLFLFIFPSTAKAESVCRVQGHKVDEKGNICNGANCPADTEVILRGWSIDNAYREESQKENPYSFDNLKPSWPAVSLRIPTGYTAAYSVCTGCADHPLESYIPGATVYANCQPNSYLDLYWQLKPAPTQKAASDNLGNKTISSVSFYKGQIFSKENYSYAPTIMKDDDGKYKMWWCSNPEKDVGGDRIWYADSLDGLNWENKQVVLSPTTSTGQGACHDPDPSEPLDSAHTCDPSVVKVNGLYHLFYTGVQSPDCDGSYNQAFLATSTDGIHWSKYPSNDDPQPVIRYPRRVQGCYGVGQSSVIYHESKFWHYYANDTPFSLGEWCNRDAVFLSTSTDGINWLEGEQVFKPNPGTGPVDVKYLPSANLFFMAYEGAAGSKIYWTVSQDGINWLPHDDKRTLFENLSANINHNVGLIGTAMGELINPGAVFYGSGDVWIPGGWYPLPSWQLHRSDFVLRTCEKVEPAEKTVIDPTQKLNVFTYGVTGAEAVRLATWSEDNGQDDLVWYDGQNQGGGKWLATIDLSHHPLGASKNGKIIIHSYLGSYPFEWNFCGQTEVRVLTGDLNNDGQVNNHDLVILLQSWGSSPANPQADLNSNGLVNGLDFNFLRKLIP